MAISGGSLSDPTSDLIGSGTIVALNGTLVVNTQGFTNVIFKVAGTWSGAMLFEATLDGTNWFTVNGILYPSGGLGALTFINGQFQVPCGSFLRVRLNAVLFTSGTANITWAAGVGDNYNVMRLADGAGNFPTSTTSSGHQRLDAAAVLASPTGLENGYYAGVSPFNRLNVSPEPSSIFRDKFDGGSIDTIRWSTAVVGTGTASQSSGQLVFTTGTTNLAAAALTSVPTMEQQANVQLNFGINIQINAATVTNTHRFWGYGTAGANTVAAPLTNAIGFEVDTAGNLNACVWSAGTKIYSQLLTRPTDGLYHRYTIVHRTDKIHFYLDGGDIPSATASYMVPAVQTLPIRIHQINGTTIATAPTLNSLAIGVTDLGRNTTGISDGTYGFRKAAVDEFGHFSSNYGNQLFSRQTSNGTTVVKSGTGVLHGYIIGNGGTNGNFILYDNTAGSGTVITNLNVGTPSGGLLSSSGFPNPAAVTGLSIRFNNGLTVVRSGSTSNELTIIYR